jgi:hypothetical protein
MIYIYMNKPQTQKNSATLSKAVVMGMNGVKQLGPCDSTSDRGSRTSHSAGLDTLSFHETPNREQWQRAAKGQQLISGVCVKPHHKAL